MIDSINVAADVPALALNALQVQFRVGRREWLTVVDDATFELRKGETLGLVGESGSGKTVTALTIAGLTARSTSRISAGSLFLHGRDLLSLSARDWRAINGCEIGVIFQEPMTSLNPSMRIGEQIAESARLHLGLNRRQAAKRAVEMLDLVGIPRADRRVSDYPHALSGGMRQRVMIAIALACNPSVLIADEPTTALDATIQAQVLELMRRLQVDLGLSILLVTHDFGVVADLCDRVAVMYAGQVIEVGTTEDVFRSPRHPYTTHLIAATPGAVRADEHKSRLTALPGNVPTPGAHPVGCRFAPRCSFVVEDLCLHSGPQLAEVLPGCHTRCVRSLDVLPPVYDAGAST